MRITKTVELFKGDEKRTVTVKEMTVKEIRNFWQHHADTVLSQKIGMLDDMAPFFAVCVSGVEWSELEDLTPSELKKIYAAFKEVNAVFFEVAKEVEGGNPLLIQLRVLCVKALMSKFAGLFNQDTGKSGTTDIASS